jgi:choline dehydrogenase-like flavoprotein
MIQDFATCTEEALIEADICIVGAGAAGITVARSLLDSGLDILLLESGGKDYEQPTRDLAEGKSVGFPYYPLAESRLRFFGGTTAVWGGRSAQLDRIDFRKRSWVEHSGWPFDKDLLRTYYRKAQKSLGLSEVDDNTLPGFESPLQDIQPAFWQFDEKFDRFTFNSCSDLTSSKNVRILLHATAVGLSPAENGRTIESLQIANLQGKRGTVRAKTYLLASGGLEIPRLLLASRHETHPNGVGNNHELVGRFFMEHPHARGARVFPRDARRLFEMLPRFIRHGGERYGMLLHPSEVLQEKEGILNSCFTIAVRKHPGEQQVFYKSVYNKLRHELSPTRLGRAAWKTTRRASIQTQDKLGPYLNRRSLAKKGNGLYAVIRAEQAPNPNSRITLSDERDSLGMPRIALDWQMSGIDKHSITRLMSAFDGELQRLGLGAVEPATWLADDSKHWETDPLVSNHSIGGYHHMGTTRMATIANNGVVDENCRVHGVENLYIAGSSVFPTGGWANPTLTIIALAIRVADRIKTAA